MWAMMPALYIRLVRDAGWPSDRFETWLSDTFIRLCLTRDVRYFAKRTRRHRPGLGGTESICSKRPSTKRCPRTRRDSSRRG